MAENSYLWIFTIRMQNLSKLKHLDTLKNLLKDIDNISDKK